MSFLKNTVSLLAIFSVVPAAFAATARPSVLNTATAVSATGAVRRMPTITSYITGSAYSGTTSSGSSSSSSLLDSVECIDAYTECIKSDDACGSDLSECTTNVLFHGKMPQCVSTLAQCSTNGIYDLFGTSSVTSLSDVYEYNDDGEVVRYTYPTDGSVLGQMVISAAIENQYDTQTCVKRYMSCLNKDTVCGMDFELCTDEREFRKQALFCDSTLARCQADGVRELFGVPTWSPHKTKGSEIASGSRVAVAIKDGADLAATNAVSTCYKVVEQCFLGACSANPLRCLEGSNLNALTAANQVAADGITIQLSASSEGTGQSTSTDVNRYLRTSCQDTIGANKFCHMTFREKTPSKGELMDVDVQSEVFDEAVSERKKYVQSKIQDLMQQFDKRAKDKCTETIRSCAMRSCGEGVGSVCYSQVMGGDDKSINSIGKDGKNNTYTEIKTACESIVNTDVNCQYAYATVADTAYSYNYINNSVFDTLFPQYDSTKTNNDPIGVVASLNASLSTSYNAAALAQMKKQCQSVATSCVKSMCGPDYQNCYRNRTDIYSSLTNTGDNAFDASMNKVGGVLDYTIVLGLCMNTVKNADVCDEHLKIEKAKVALNQDITSAWGSQSNVRGGWVDAGGAKTFEDNKYEVHATDADGQYLCTNGSGDEGICYTVDANGNVFDKPVMTSVDQYKTNSAATSLFRELLVDIEHEAQAKYNAKLTKQQNMCLSANTGGIVGAKDTGSTFMWVKLKSGKVPNNYSTNGLLDTSIVPSNELYGSFCRVRVNLQSADPTISDWLQGAGKEYATRYFAAGDAFTCGSWIPMGSKGSCHADSASGIEKCNGGTGLMGLAQKVAEASYTYDKKTSDTLLQTMIPVAGLLGGGIGGAYLGAGIEDGSVFGGLSGKKNSKNKEKDSPNLKKQCENAVSLAKDYLDNKNYSAAKSAAKKARDILADMDSTYKELEFWPTDMPTDVTKKHNTDCSGTTAGSTECLGTKTISAAKTEIQAKFTKLEQHCKSAEDTSDEVDEKKRTNAAIAGAVTTGVVSSVLTWGVTRSIIQANRTKEQQAAIDEFMSSLGSKINCVVGGDPLAVYGDTVVTSME